MRKNLAFLMLSLIFMGLSYKLHSQSSFYDIDQIQNIELQFEEEDWAYQLDSLAATGDNLIIGKAIINGKEYNSVAVQYIKSSGFKPGEKKKWRPH